MKDLISCRETALSSLCKRAKLQEIVKTPLRVCRLMECYVLLASAVLSRAHGALQNALTTTTYLSHLVGPCQAAGLNVTGVSQLESAHVLWSQGEREASVRLLRELTHGLDKETLETQSIPIGKPELLAKLVRPML